ncbi:MAG: serine hydrolase domain-containing protein [Sideroxyarcus sp.]|nr:serine hydrolase domain-containing protein [Sideroxyarcus sp.]
MKIEQYLLREGAGLQYVVVTHADMLVNHAAGFSDIKHRIAVNPQTTMAAFSMTKTLTAIAVLQLVDAQKIRLDDHISRYVTHPYDQNITIRQLLNHTAGIPNPLPLRWIHSTDEHVDFNENAALSKVLSENGDQKYAPGERYYYSNIGYWLLGGMVEKVTGEKYEQYMTRHIFQPLKLKPEELGFNIANIVNHAHGYLEKYSLMNAVKGFLLDDWIWQEYEDGWLRISDVYLNGPAFGGAIGSASAFGRILQDLLGEHSALLSDASLKLLFEQSENSVHEQIEMTLGWHVKEVSGIRYFYKEGGGTGFHAEMRIYPGKGIGSVVMVNQTNFNSTKFLNQLDAEWIR